MSAQTQVTDTAIYSPSHPMQERSAWYIPGPLLLLVDLVLVAATVVAFWQSAVHTGAVRAVLIIVGIASFLQRAKPQAGSGGYFSFFFSPFFFMILVQSAAASFIASLTGLPLVIAA